MTFPIVTELPQVLEPLSRDMFVETAPRGADTPVVGPVRRRIVD
jgi:hypothetical protein